VFGSHLGGQIRIPKTAEVLAGRVRKQIILGELKPGDKLPPEAQLIADFEVSRPTIREAIRILESEGLISVSRGARGGARVNAVSTDLVTRAAGVALQAKGATLRDVYEVRALIEPPAARLAAERRAPEAAAALRLPLERALAVVGDDLKRAKPVTDFHRILLEECGNVALAVVGKALAAVVERHIALTYRYDITGAPRMTEAAHRKGLKSREELVALIAAGDGPGAEAHWVDHMARTADFWLKHVGSTSVIDVLE